MFANHHIAMNTIYILGQGIARYLKKMGLRYGCAWNIIPTANYAHIKIEQQTLNIKKCANGNMRKPTPGRSL